MRIPGAVTLLVAAAALLAHCAGTFTHVPLPNVQPSDLRTLRQSVEPIDLPGLEALLKENYYKLLYAEGEGDPDEPLPGFLERKLRDEEISPVWLVTITSHQLELVAKRSPWREAQALAGATRKARAPLERRLARVSQRVARAAGRPDIRFSLEPSLGLNAGAPWGFSTRQVLVGPQLLLLCADDDALAFVLGHEVAHIEHGHTRAGMVQALLVGTLRVAAVVAVHALEASNRRNGHRRMSARELRDSSAAAASLVGGVATGAIRASGFGRDQEREADYHGLDYARAAGYRPEAAQDFLRTMLALEGGVASGVQIPLLATHPPTAERAVRVAKWSAPEEGVLVATAPAPPTPKPPARETVAHPKSEVPAAEPLSDEAALVAMVPAPPTPEPPAQVTVASPKSEEPTAEPIATGLTERPAPSTTEVKPGVPRPREPETPEPETGSPLAIPLETETQLPPEESTPQPATTPAEQRICWASRGRLGQGCTTCCLEGACRTECTAVSDVEITRSVPRPPICWNVDAMEDGEFGICTTCCTADVSCDTSCSVVDAISRDDPGKPSG